MRRLLGRGVSVMQPAVLAALAAVSLLGGVRCSDLPAAAFVVRTAGWRLAEKAARISEEVISSTIQPSQCRCMMSCLVSDLCLSFSHHPTSFNCTLFSIRGNVNTSAPEAGAVVRYREGLAYLGDWCSSDQECSFLTSGVATCQQNTCSCPPGQSSQSKTTCGDVVREAIASVAGAASASQAGHRATMTTTEIPLSASASAESSPPTTPPSVHQTRPTAERTYAAGSPHTALPTSTTASTSTTEPTSITTSTSTTEPTSTMEPISTTASTSTTEPTSTTTSASATEPTSTMEPISTTALTSTTEPTSTTASTSTTEPISTTASTSTTEPASTMEPISTTTSTSTTEPTPTTTSTSTKELIFTAASTSPTEPTSTAISVSTTEPTSTATSTSTTEPTSTTISVSTTELTSTIISVSTTEPISTTTSSSTTQATSTTPSTTITTPTTTVTLTNTPGSTTVSSTTEPPVTYVQKRPALSASGEYIMHCNDPPSNIVAVGLKDEADAAAPWSDLDQINCAKFNRLPDLVVGKETYAKRLSALQDDYSCPEGSMLVALASTGSFFLTTETMACGAVQHPYRVDLKDCAKVDIVDPAAMQSMEEDTQSWPFQCPQLPMATGIVAFTYRAGLRHDWKSITCCLIKSE